MSTSQPIPFFQLTHEFKALEAEWFAAIRASGECGQFILGPQVEAFERRVATRLETPYAIGVANGTDALVLALRALAIGPGDEVITTPYTFFATVEAILQAGATPVFVDIQADTFNLDASQIPAHISARTRAILPVHLFGHPADMEHIMDLAREYDLKVIEDAAQAFGATLADRPVGSWGHAGCFSFYPTKVLGCYGDGGLVTSHHEVLNQGVRHLRTHGASAPFIHDAVGYNSRLDEIQAALLNIKLRQVDQAIAQRRWVAERYEALLADTNVICPSRALAGTHVFNLYTIRSSNRAAVRSALSENHIGSAVCYPQPLHLQAVCRALGYAAGDLPVAERVATEALSLPIFPGMTGVQIERVCEVIRQVV
ncbi:hypothetical protein Tel_01660 [Candidatus Tenderia electrophaga]|jgi:dTDP-4-amino-4,6-dideoxygalactose transaminase|uniref:Erythromycin biosynthesis sensory transduction protein eryC1 n=1 Tax=Candidatus Tenderia electrophaga TaxID=1748243 RepID=A0A0S2T9X6_9GAMM|nr:hypothetical protein Tel_01660 [Candidatus Tenderia electrophaga]